MLPEPLFQGHPVLGAELLKAWLPAEEVLVSLAPDDLVPDDLSAIIAEDAFEVGGPVGS
jgi:hypothetical protein